MNWINIKPKRLILAAHGLDLVALLVEDVLDFLELGLQLVIGGSSALDAGPQVRDVGLSGLHLEK